MKPKAPKVQRKVDEAKVDTVQQRRVIESGRLALENWQEFTKWRRQAKSLLQKCVDDLFLKGLAAAVRHWKSVASAQSKALEATEAATASTEAATASEGLASDTRNGCARRQHSFDEAARAAKPECRDGDRLPLRIRNIMARTWPPKTSWANIWHLSDTTRDARSSGPHVWLRRGRVAFRLTQHQLRLTLLAWSAWLALTARDHPIRAAVRAIRKQLLYSMLIHWRLLVRQPYQSESLEAVPQMLSTTPMTSVPDYDGEFHSKRPSPDAGVPPSMPPDLRTQHVWQEDWRHLSASSREVSSPEAGFYSEPLCSARGLREEQYFHVHSTEHMARGLAPSENVSSPWQNIRSHRVQNLNIQYRGHQCTGFPSHFRQRAEYHYPMDYYGHDLDLSFTSSVAKSARQAFEAQRRPEGTFRHEGSVPSRRGRSARAEDRFRPLRGTRSAWR